MMNKFILTIIGVNLLRILIIYRLDDYVKQLAANESLENRVKFLDQQVSNQQGIQSELSGDLEKAVNRANIVSFCLIV